MATKKKAAQPAPAAKKAPAKKAAAKKSAPAKKAPAKKAPAKKTAAPAAKVDVKVEIPNDLVWADTKPAEVTEAVAAVAKLGFWKRLFKRA